MKTFKQYMIDEMGGDLSTDYVSTKTGTFSTDKASRVIKPIMFDADVLLRRAKRLSSETLIQQANDLLNKFVSEYENLGDEATDLKAQIADKYTQVKQLLKRDIHTVEDCVQMLEQVANLLHG